MTILWYETWDNDGNSIWEGGGPYSDDDGVRERVFRGFVGNGVVACCWRLRQRLFNNRIEWYADHDPELGGQGEFWLTLAEAKTACQEAHDRILEETASND